MHRQRSGSEARFFDRFSTKLNIWTVKVIWNFSWWRQITLLRKFVRRSYKYKLHARQRERDIDCMIWMCTFEWVQFVKIVHGVFFRISTADSEAFNSNFHKYLWTTVSRKGKCYVFEVVNHPHLGVYVVGGTRCFREAAAPLAAQRVRVVVWYEWYDWRARIGY